MKSFPYYPIFIDVEDHDVAIIGGGEVCARKAETMMRYGARVTIVSPEFTDEIESWGRDGKPLRFSADGFHARVVQHERDHLDGKVYLDRMRSMETLTFLPEFQRYWLPRAR